MISLWQNQDLNNVLYGVGKFWAAVKVKDHLYEELYLQYFSCSDISHLSTTEPILTHVIFNDIMTHIMVWLAARVQPDKNSRSGTPGTLDSLSS